MCKGIVITWQVDASDGHKESAPLSCFRHGLLRTCLIVLESAECSKVTRRDITAGHGTRPQYDTVRYGNLSRARELATVVLSRQSEVAVVATSSLIACIHVPLSSRQRFIRVYIKQWIGTMQATYSNIQNIENLSLYENLKPVTCFFSHTFFCNRGCISTISLPLKRFLHPLPTKAFDYCTLNDKSEDYWRGDSSFGFQLLLPKSSPHTLSFVPFDHQSISDIRQDLACTR